MTRYAVSCLLVWVTADAQDLTDTEIVLGCLEGAPKPKAFMSRKLTWIEEPRFRGFGCTECGWRFTTSGAPTGTSFDEMMRNFELQRDREFASHVCAGHPKGKSTTDPKR